MTRRWLSAGLLLVAVWQLGSAGWIHAKADLGQWLLARAWAAHRSSGEPVEPWPGAVSHPVARLRVPRLSVDQLVLSGLETPVMAWGPGMAIGEGGHRVIAAHRDTHFAFLRLMRMGDRLQLLDADGQASWWRVERLEVVDARTTGLDLHGAGKVLTLVTCYPFDAAVAGGPERFVVRLGPLAPGEASS